MADVQISDNSEKKSTRKRKFIRVDMTPLVDLGFLLITFFMFTSNFSKPNIMNLGLPAEGNVRNEIDYRNQITFLLGKDNRILYYQQELKNLKSSDIKESSYKGTDIAKLIENKKSIAPKPEIFTIIVKPTDDATYQNFVDVLDEIAISNNERYGISEMQKTEEDIYKELIK